MERTPDFDPIARFYWLVEAMTFGPALQRCRTYFLPRVLDRRCALVLGDGDGRFLARLLAVSPEMRADAVDTSAAMLRLLDRRCAAVASTPVQLHCMSAVDYTPAGVTDLVVAHFFFDCLVQADLETLVDRVARHTRPDALWLVSDFRIPRGRMRHPARLLVRSLYAAFRLLTGLRTTHLPNHLAAMRRAGLMRVARHRSLGGLLTTELWQRNQ